MAALPPEALAAALGAVHKTGLNTDPNAATPGSSSGGGGAPAPSPDAGADPSQGDPTQAGADPNADSNAADPEHQAIWKMFPSTDPNFLQSLVSQGGDPEEAISQMVQQGESDLGQFKQMQDALFMHLAAMFGTPQDTGIDQGGTPPQDPGVGGQGAGY